MSLFVKICGITSVEAAAAAAAAGADALGFVFAKSPRRLTPAQATDITRNLPGHVEKVAVFLRPQPGEIEAVLAGFSADTIQANWSYLAGFEGRPVLPVVRDGGSSELDGRRILFEGRRSGAGERADWTLAADLARRSPLILAGGLNSETVRSAIQSVHPFGVDVSSGVESSPGIKDIRLINGFINEVRKIEREVVTK